MDYTQVFAALAVALGASFCSGINLYATVGMLGLMHRFMPGFQLPGDLSVLASDWVVWPALAMYGIEFVADKVPAVDSAWDAFHTFIRVPAGAVLAAMALGDVGLEFQVLAALLGGTLALGTHATKAGVRLAGHTTLTSGIVTPTASIVEDAFVVGAMWLVAEHPVLALFAVSLLSIGVFFLLRAVWRLARRGWNAVFGGRPAIGGRPSADDRGLAADCT